MDYIACQSPLPRGFSRQEHWSGLPFPSPGNLLNPGIEPQVSCTASRFFTDWATSREVPTWGYVDILKCAYKTLSCFVWLEYQSGFLLLKVSKIPTKFGLSKKNCFFFYSCKWRFHNIGRAVSRRSGGIAFLGASFNPRQAFSHHSLMALVSDSPHFTSSIKDGFPFIEALAGPTGVECSALKQSGQSSCYSYTQNTHTQAETENRREIDFEKEILVAITQNINGYCAGKAITCTIVYALKNNEETDR